MDRDRQGVRTNAVLLVFSLIAALLVVGVSDTRVDDGPLLDPLIPEGAETLAEVCAGICTADLVALPELRVVESVVDLPMPESTGALSVERVWTGERTGLFGAGWESIWDVRVVDGKLRGPIPSMPVVRAEPGGQVAFEDGTVITFDDGGRPLRVCVDGAMCASAEWSDDVVRLSGGPVSVELRVTDGRVVSAESGDGRKVDYGFEGGRLTSVRGDGIKIDYAYAGGHLSRIVGDGARSFAYEGSVLQSMTDRDGGEWAFSDVGNGAVEVTRPDGEVVTYEFDGRSLTKATGSESGVWLTRTYEHGVLTGESRPRDGVTMKRVLPDTIEVTRERGLEPAERSRFTFDRMGRVVHAASGDGDIIINYDGLSNRPVSSGPENALTTMEYDEAGLLMATTDPDGYRVTVRRDELGQVSSVSDGVLATTFTYDPSGAPIAEESDGRTASATYTASGQLESLSLPDGSAMAVAYDETDKLQSVGSDDVGDLVSQVDATPDSAEPSDRIESVREVDDEYEYSYESGRVARFDDWGRLTGLRDENGSLSRSYDEQGRVVEVVRTDGRKYSVTYTPAGRIRSVSDGTMTAELTWHGDLLTGAVTSTGANYGYGYNARGQLVTSQVGGARWTYGYDDSGNLSAAATPSGPTAYTWDELGRPKRAVIDGRSIDYTWAGSELNLEAVTGPNGDLVRFERNDSGQVTSVKTADGSATFEYTKNALTHYKLATGVEATLTYDEQGRVSSVESGGRTEQWEWSGSEIGSVTVDGRRYDLEWLSPGILESVSTDGKSVMHTVTDDSGKPIAVKDAKNEVAEFTWKGGALSEASVDKWHLSAGYDDEFRPTKLAVDGATATLAYRDGIPTGLVVNDTSVESTYEDGRLAASEFRTKDRRSTVQWSASGELITAATDEGTASFEYDRGRLSGIGIGDKVDKVGYEDGGVPSSDGVAGEFVDDLFGRDGRFILTAGEHLSEPWTPWFDALPVELGLRLPAVTTASDVASAAIGFATPNAVAPVDPGNDIARRTAQMVLATSAPSVVPVSADRLATFVPEPGQARLDSILAASPAALAGASAVDNLVKSPGLLQKALNIGAGLVNTIGGAGAAVTGLFTESTVGKVIFALLPVVISAVTAACVASALCPVVGAGATAAITFGPMLLQMAPALLSGGMGLQAALAALFIDPAVGLLNGVMERDPMVLLQVAAMVASVVILHSATKANPRLLSGDSRFMTAVCRQNVVACTSVSRFGEAGEHVLEAQRNGASRILKLDRAGASARRSSALRGVDRRLGFDRDEYPPAFSARRSGLSIKHIDPSSNRSLGGYLGRQARGLPNGSRVWVLPVA